MKTNSIKTKNFLALTLLLTVAFSAPSAFSQELPGPRTQPPQLYGTGDGGGGVGVRCGSELKLLDYVEALQKNISISHNPKNKEEAIDLVAQLITQLHWAPDSHPLSAMESVLTLAVIQPIFDGKSLFNAETKQYEDVTFTGRPLPLSKDIGEYSIPPKCHLEQIAYYSDVNKNLVIHRARWNELDWLNKAMLVAHEVAYLMDRREGLHSFFTGTSEFARTFVGELFSEQGLPPRSLNLKSSVKVCSGYGKEPTYFYLASKDAHQKVVFSTLFNKSTLYTASATFKNSFTGNDFSETSDIIFEGSSAKSNLAVLVKKERGTLSLTLLKTSSVLKPQRLAGPQNFDCEEI